MSSWSLSPVLKSRGVIITGISMGFIGLCIIGYKRTVPTYVPSLSEACEIPNLHKLAKDGNVPARDELARLFHFVPPTLCSCSQLFYGNSTLPKAFQERFDIFEKESNRHRGTFEVLAGYTALRAHSYKAYVTMASFPFVKTVCETGFNAGHSSFGWLAMNPNTHVYSFDIGVHGYSRPMADYLQKEFPGRLNVTWGDSTKTLPDFHSRHPEVTCDLIIIDGGHSYDVCKADFDNFRRMAKRDNILILDDYPSPDNMILGDVWEPGKINNEVIEFFHCNDAIDKSTAWYRAIHGFSVGRYVNL